MTHEELIPAADFCTHHQIEVSFLHSLQDYGLVEMTTVEHNVYLHPEQLSALEKFIRLHYDLHVNLEGLDVIHHMLSRVEDLQREIGALRNRLRFYGE